MAAALAGVGCGGGQGGGPAAGGGAAKTSKVGDAVITYFGDPKAQATSSAGTVTVVAQAGASFSNITLEPPPNLASTYFAFGRGVNGPFEMFTMPYGGQTPQVLYQNVGGAGLPGISAYGTIAFDAKTSYNAYSIRYDGTGFTQLSFTGASAQYWPQYSVDGTNRLCFSDGVGHLFKAPGTGGTATQLQSNCALGKAVWSPNGSDIAYPVLVSGGQDIYMAPSAGGSPTDITPIDLRGSGTLEPMAWSADGVTILASYAPTGGSVEQIIRFDSTNTGAYVAMTPTGDQDLFGAYSPDGSKFLFYRNSSGGATPGLYVADSTGVSQNLVLADQSNGLDNGVDGGLAWSPFLPKETVVAASASTFYHQAASGYLLSENGSLFGSMVAFTATTPSSAAVQTPSTSDSSAPMAFTLTADAITSLGYINDYFGTGTTVSLSSTPSVVVTVDAGTGQVDLVAPASVAKPSIVKNADGTVTYKAVFRALYDGKGNNLAPNGASQVTVNPKSGKLVSFR